MTQAMRTFVFESELQRIADFTAGYRSLETGGNLFGYFTHSGAPVVCLATGPGPRARHQGTAFYQDEEFLEGCAKVLFQSCALQHVGEWHSHHRLRLFEPSGGDVRTVRTGMEQMGWSRFLLGIANWDGPGISAGFFLFDGDVEPRECSVQVLPGNSPFCGMYASLPRGESARTSWRRARWSLRQPRVAWYEEPEARRRLAKEVRGLELLRTSHALHYRLLPAGDRVDLEVSLEGRASERWELGAGFPDLAPQRFIDAEVVAIDWRPESLIAEFLLQTAETADQPAPDAKESLVIADRADVGDSITHAASRSEVEPAPRPLSVSSQTPGEGSTPDARESSQQSCAHPSAHDAVEAIAVETLSSDAAPGASSSTNALTGASSDGECACQTQPLSGVKVEEVRVAESTEGHEAQTPQAGGFEASNANASTVGAKEELR